MIPPGQRAAFVAQMADVLAVSARPPAPARPLVCCAEAGKELRAQVRPPQPLMPGTPAREDSASRRDGSAHLCCFCAPHRGWRQCRITTQRTHHDWAEAMRTLVDTYFPDAAKIVRGRDNRNPQTPAALAATFAPAAAKRIWDKLELHYTPKHGSWRNLAEPELRVVARPWLARRIPDPATLATEVAVWVAARNAAGIGRHWRFTVTDARTKLAFRDPALQPANE